MTAKRTLAPKVIALKVLPLKITTVKAIAQYMTWNYFATNVTALECFGIINDWNVTPYSYTF